MALQLNQFAMTSVQGQLDLQTPGNSLSGQADLSNTTNIVAGQAVKMTTTSGGVPKFAPVTANDDTIYGFACRNLKDQYYAPGAELEVALPESVMSMTAGGAITRGASVIIDYVNNYVNTNDFITPTVGQALDTAVNVGDLIRVQLKSAGGSSAAFGRTESITATLAQINAGLLLIPGAPGKSITVTNVIQRIVGSFASGTSINLVSSATSVIVESTAESALTSGAVLTPNSSGVTLGAGFGVALPAGEGLKVVNVGSAQTGGTSDTFTIVYQQA